MELVAEGAADSEALCARTAAGRRARAAMARYIVRLVERRETVCFGGFCLVVEAGGANADNYWDEASDVQDELELNIFVRFVRKTEGE